MNRSTRRAHKQWPNTWGGSEYRSRPPRGILIDTVSARRQLAFDIWWLAFALWLVCIIEVRQGRTAHRTRARSLTSLAEIAY